MNPEQIPQVGIEQQPAQVETGQYLPSPETAVFDTTAERFEQRAESSVVENTPAPVAPVADNPTTVPVVAEQVVNTTIASNPETAKDSESIEKEWVDRVKQVLKDNRDDPYKKEEEIKRMKVDFIKKRFNRDIGKVD